jgi:glutathione synthase/RimK-type ligase-like ATP-grasp enzyme
LRYFVYPYKKGSKSAKLLAQKLEGKVIKLTNSRFRPTWNKVVINWGNARVRHPGLLGMNTYPGDATNKLNAFNVLKGIVSIPEYTESKEVAQEWVRKGKTVVARSVLTGHSGRGITIVSEGEVPDAPLYVQYIPKKAEYRIHVFGDKVIHIQEKRLKQGHSAHKVRSHSNGYVFAVNGVEAPQMALDEALKAVDHLGLSFGAVDVIWNEKQQKAYVLEVNTAPGLCNTTAQKYADAIKEIA